MKWTWIVILEGVDEKEMGTSRQMVENAGMTLRIIETESNELV